MLTLADSRSSASRKNPAGAVEAFRRAFGDSDRARLIVKLNGRPDEMSALSRALAGPGVETLCGHLDDAAMAALYDRVDALISLHRAEGFGLPMLESMARGVPVVATGWSGNMDFMGARDSVRPRTVTIPI